MPQYNPASSGGVLSALNLTAPTTIKVPSGIQVTTSGRLSRILIISPGSGSGAFTLNDCVSLAAAAAGNVIWSLPYNSALNVAGQVLFLDFPFKNGLVLSALPGAGAPALSLTFS